VLLQARHFIQAPQLPDDLPGDAVQLRPDLGGQAAMPVRDFVRVRVPAVEQPSLDHLAGLYLVTEELDSDPPIEPAGVQGAGG